MYRTVFAFLLVFLGLVIASSCSNAGGFDLSHYVDNTYNWKYSSQEQEFVDFTLCGRINVTCGISGEVLALSIDPFFPLFPLPTPSQPQENAPAPTAAPSASSGPLTAKQTELALG
jgi:hypothetical protein